MVNLSSIVFKDRSGVYHEITTLTRGFKELGIPYGTTNNQTQLKKTFSRLSDVFIEYPQAKGIENVTVYATNSTFSNASYIKTGLINIGFKDVRFIDDDFKTGDELHFTALNYPLYVNTVNASNSGLTTVYLSKNNSTAVTDRQVQPITPARTTSAGGGVNGSDIAGTHSRVVSTEEGFLEILGFSIRLVIHNLTGMITGFGFSDIRGSDISKSIQYETLWKYYDLVPYNTDPYKKGGVDENAPIGGGGNFDDESDIAELPATLPTFAQTISLYSIWIPTTEQLQAFVAWLWSSDFFSNIKKMFSSPIDSIFSLHALPVNGLLYTDMSMIIGNVDTGITMRRTGHEYVEIPCGEVDVAEYWGSALDYSPFTKVSIFLPYIGFKTLNIDDVQNSTVTLTYRIEVSTGACTAFIVVNGSVMYQFVGNCAKKFPISAQNFSDVYSSLASIATTAGAIAATAATEGMTAPLAVGAAGQTANNVISAKPHTQYTGILGDVYSWLGVQIPYLIFERPKQSLPANNNAFEGYPANYTTLLASVEGYTEVRLIHLENIIATTEELNEIETLLKGGVFF